jgi:hypothetical protein
MERAEEGAVVVITGPIDHDEHWLPGDRSESFGNAATIRPVSPTEFFSVGGREYSVGFRGEKIQRVEKAVLDASGVSGVHVIRRGKGTIIWTPLPVELGESEEPVAALYGVALREAGCTPDAAVSPDDPAILLLSTGFDDAVLYTLVSESDRERDVTLTHRETQTPLRIRLPAQRSALLFVERRSGRVISQLSR